MTQVQFYRAYRKLMAAYNCSYLRDSEREKIKQKLNKLISTYQKSDNLSQ